MIRNPKRLLLSLLVVFAACALGSVVTFPSIAGWYAGLAKPSFNPPNWVFGPVWTLLFTLMGVSLYMVWESRQKRSKRTAYILFGLQLTLNVLWSAVFFGLHQPDFALAVIVALLAAVVATIVAFWPFSRTAAILLMPYALWICFASALNGAVSILNPHPNGVGSYQQCAQASGSVILTTYPAVCMTRDGQRFTDDQQTSVTLTIHEWGVQLPLVGAISDAYYNFDAKNNEIYLTTTRLEGIVQQATGCTAGMHGLYYKFDDQKLVQRAPIEAACMPNDLGRKQQTSVIRTQLQAAAQSAVFAK